MSNAVVAIRANTVENGIARRVQNLMWDFDLSAKEVADAAGLEYSGFSRRLAGKRGWSPDDIALVSYVLNVSIAYLFGESAEPTRPTPENRKALGNRFPRARTLPDLDSNQEPAGTSSAAGLGVSELSAHPRFRRTPADGERRELARVSAIGGRR